MKHQKSESKKIHSTSHRETIWAACNSLARGIEILSEILEIKSTNLTMAKINNKFKETQET